jgi:hypothetical protein
LASTKIRISIKKVKEGRTKQLLEELAFPTPPFPNHRGRKWQLIPQNKTRKILFSKSK